MINQSTTLKLIAFLVLTNALLVGLYVFAYYKVDAYEVKTSTINSEIGVNEEGKEAFRRLEKSVKSTETDRQKLASYFVNEDGVVGFLQEVESLGKPSGASVQLTAVSKHAEAKDKYLELSVNATGSFEQVFHFVSLLENLPYQISLSQVSLVREEEEKKGTVPVNASSTTSSAKKWTATVTFDLQSYDPGSQPASE